MSSGVRSAATSRRRRALQCERAAGSARRGCPTAYHKGYAGTWPTNPKHPAPPNPAVVRARRAVTPSPAQLADAPEFAPVPRRCARFDGWTADRQRAFVAALAATGTVTRAAHAIGMTAVSAYQLRKQPGAEAFAEAWADALAIGVEKLADIAMERAMHGVPVPVFYQGEQVGERRWYNDRLLMWTLRHADPERYGGATGHRVPPHVRAALRAEWEAERRAGEEGAEAIRDRIRAKMAAEMRAIEREDAPALPPPEAKAPEEVAEPPVPPAELVATRAEVEEKWRAHDAEERFRRESALDGNSDYQSSERNMQRHWQALVDTGKFGGKGEG